MKELDEALRAAAADEAETESLLREKAEELHRAGKHSMASTYDQAAAKAEDRANVWRGLLKKDRK